MAYQARSRDPLFDSNMAEAIEKRGKELIGIALILGGLAAAAMIWSYSPSDPWWMSATDAPVQNWLGRFGASTAPMFMIVGWGAWGVAIVALAWGLRFAFHRGNGRAIGRLIFAPIWIALLSIYAATLVPGPEWTHSFGLGGLFGKTALGSLINILPIQAATGLKILSISLGVAMVALAAFVLWLTRPELRQIARNSTLEGHDPSLCQRDAASGPHRQGRHVHRPDAEDQDRRAPPPARKRPPKPQNGPPCRPSRWQLSPPPPPRSCIHTEPPSRQRNPAFSAAPPTSSVRPEPERMDDPEPELVETRRGCRRCAGPVR
ncbi:MAG: DNA translocase FtsK 4TM domain-containing protein [Paracoccaceae bacterium]